MFLEKNWMVFYALGFMQLAAAPVFWVLLHFLKNKVKNTLARDASLIAAFFLSLVMWVSTFCAIASTVAFTVMLGKSSDAGESTTIAILLAVQLLAYVATEPCRRIISTRISMHLLALLLSQGVTVVAIVLS